MKNSFKNLKDVPAIENYDVMIYLNKSCDHSNEQVASSMLKSVEFLTPRTGLLIFNF